MKPKKSISVSIREAIGLRAYHIWEREGRPEGREHLHWLLAEEQILREQPAEETPLLPHHSATVMAVPVNRKPVETKDTKTNADKTPKAKAIATAAGATKTKASPAKTKKTTKAKPAPRSS